MANRFEEHDDLDNRFDRDVKREPSLLRCEAGTGSDLIGSEEAAALDDVDRGWSGARDQVIRAHVELHGTRPTDEFINEAATNLLAGGAS